MSTDDVVLCDIDGGVATLTLNRPAANNGWTGAMQVRYFDLLVECEANPDVRAIVVTGAGKSFCPGADMDVLSAASGRGNLDGEAPAPITSPRPGYTPMLINKPLIGAINGACAGVGLVQALMLDVRIAAAGAKFTFAFARRGLIAEYGSAWLLPRIVGQANALDLLMSSRVVLADEARSLGLVNRVVEREQVLETALAYAHDLAENCCPTSMALMKQQVMADWQRTLPESVAVADREMDLSIQRPDFKEGVISFLERRAPTFAPYVP